MRVLVTGGSGYIGTRLMRLLAARPDVEEIIDVDIKPPSRAVPENVRYVSRSVTEDLSDLFTDPPGHPIDVAMHLAWVLDPLADAAAQQRICIGGTNRFLDGCLAGNVGHVVFVSSASAYGANPRHAIPVDEAEPLKVAHHFQYSAEKREAEGLFRRFAADRPDTLLQIVRPCVVGGPNVSNFIFRSIDKPVTFRALGLDPHLQLVHEDDCAAALAAIVESRLPGAFNVAADGLLTVTELYARLGVRALPVPLPALLTVADVAWNRGWSFLTEAPAGFVYFIAYPWLASNRRLKEEVGFRFRYDVEQTIATYLSSRR